MGEWNKNKLVGNIGESIVEYLINSMPDWKCVKFGVEDTIKDLKEMVRKSINPVTTKIRKMPDFVAFNEKTGETFFIEVKHRSNSKKGYLIKYLEDYNQYWDGTKLVIVRPNEPHFVYIDLKKIDEDSMREIEEGKPPRWNFEGIEQEIKDLFPDLNDENIEEAIKMIPKKRIN